MASSIDIGCALLCAGESKRFYEGNKLLQQFHGKRIIDWAIDALPSLFLCNTVAVCQPGAVLNACKNAGLNIVINPHPELTISYSVQLATRALRDMDAILFMVADQPFLKSETILKCIDIFMQNPSFIIAPEANGRRGNPVIFPRVYFQSLMHLPHHKGGGHVIKNNSKTLKLFHVADERELWDIDTVEELRRLTLNSL